MRLLKRVASADGDNFSLTLEEHGGPDVPPYAILSHCWGPSNEEVSYADLNNISPGILAKAGYDKIWRCMQHAAEDGFEYLWVDTCCIDKSSSAELSEGINSMFAWYRDAAVCYAYLEDVRSGFEDPQEPASEFRASRWFTRGWTLQELIAPRSVIFTAKNWMEIGTKESLVEVVAEITNIDRNVLLQQGYGVVSLAKRMSWAAKRQTTRIEDRAYSLLGLFNVHMPTIYGEGKNAFWRLQYEILKVSDDHTIFAYDPDPSPVLRHFGDVEEFEECFEDHRLPGMLATSPTHFASSSDYSPLRKDIYFERYSNFSVRKELQLHQMTNVGFNIGLPILRIESQEMMDSLLRDRKPRRAWADSYKEQWLAMIACSGPSKLENCATCIFLAWSNDEENQHQDQYMRVSWDGQSTVEVNLDGLGWGAFEYKQVYIIGHINDNSTWHPWSHVWWVGKYHFKINFDPSGLCQMIDAAPRWMWDNNSFTTGGGGFSPIQSGAMTFCLLDTAEMLFAVLGVSIKKPWCYLEISESRPRLDEILNSYIIGAKRPVGSRLDLRVDWFALTSIRTPGRRIVMKICMDKNPPELCTARITVYDDDNVTFAASGAGELKLLNAA